MSVDVSSVAEELDTVADGELKYIVENLQYIPDKAAVKTAVVGLMCESLSQTRFVLMKTAQRCANSDKEATQ